MSVRSAPVVPNFTTGTVTSHTTTTTTMSETIRQVDYNIGHSYTVSGTNINIPATPALGADYSIQVQGEPFQFSETYFGAGVSRVTDINRTITTQSTTDSLSVFSQ